MSNWPKTISVAGRRVKLVFKPLEDLFGQYLHDDRTIEINSSLSFSEQIDTIRHEMIEAALLITGVGFMERYDQEPIVRCIDEVWFPDWVVFLERVSKV
jgi:hypothetical protein